MRRPYVCVTHACVQMRRTVLIHSRERRARAPCLVCQVRNVSPICHRPHTQTHTYCSHTVTDKHTNTHTPRNIRGHTMQRIVVAVSMCALQVQMTTAALARRERLARQSGEGHQRPFLRTLIQTCVQHTQYTRAHASAISAGSHA